MIRGLFPPCSRTFYHGPHNEPTFHCPGWPLANNPLWDVPTFVLAAELERRGKITPGAVARDGEVWALVSHGPDTQEWEKVRG